MNFTIIDVCGSVIFKTNKKGISEGVLWALDKVRRYKWERSFSAWLNMLKENNVKDKDISVYVVVNYEDKDGKMPNAENVRGYCIVYNAEDIAKLAHIIVDDDDTNNNYGQILQDYVSYHTDSSNLKYVWSSDFDYERFVTNIKIENMFKQFYSHST